MNNTRNFDAKYAALGVFSILLVITVLVILPNVVKKKLAAIGK